MNWQFWRQFTAVGGGVFLWVAVGVSQSEANQEETDNKNLGERGEKKKKNNIPRQWDCFGGVYRRL